MNRIPTEIWDQIFIKLDLKDKLKCMLVCRSWYNTLDQHSLLHTLDISSYQFPKLKEMIEGQPHRANQVEHLTVQGSYRFPDKSIFCNMFPNLREIILPHSDSLSDASLLNSPILFTNSSSKLEKITDYGRCELTRQLTMSNMCSNLKSLELSYLHRFEAISNQLKNMPVLEILVLREPEVNLMDLEKLHRNIPSVRTLRLYHIFILSGQFPQDARPASLLTELEVGVRQAKDLNTHIQFYKYIGNKYPSIKKPICDDSMVYYNSSLWDNIVDYARDVYNEGIIPFYQKIGSQSDKFEFKRYCDGLDAFSKFDQVGMKLKELTIQQRKNDNIPFLEELVQSQQSKYIQKLILKDVFPEAIEMMMNMEALTYLEINFTCTNRPYHYIFKPTINFSQLVDACSATITHLLLKGLSLEFNESTSNVTSIRDLKLVDVYISSPTTILGTSFPKLTTLCLYATVMGNFTMSLPNSHLKEVSINIKYPVHKPCGLAITVMKEGMPQRSVIWPTDGTAVGGLLYGSDVPASGSTGMTMVEFTCASIEKSSYEISQEEEEKEDDYDYYDNDNDYYYYGESDYDDF